MTTRLGGTSLAVTASRLVHGRASRRPGDRRYRGLGPGGDDHRTPRGQRLVAHLHGALAGDPSVAAHQRDPVGVEPRRLVVVVEVVDHLVAALEDGRHVEAVDRLGGARDAPGLGQHLAGAQQRLGGHAAVEGALAADEVLLDDDDLQPGVGQAPRAHLARRARHRSPRHRSCARSWRPVNPGATRVTRPWHPARMLRPAVALALAAAALLVALWLGLDCREGRHHHQRDGEHERRHRAGPPRRRAARRPAAACAWSRSASSRPRST